jgi:hypothetical protein
VYTTGPRIISDLKIAVLKQISAMPENTAMRARLEERVRKDEQHLSDVLLKMK